jgi:hypothetical protein
VRAAVAALVAATAVAALAGCGGDDPGLPEFTGGSGASAAATGGAGASPSAAPSATGSAFAVAAKRPGGDRGEVYDAYLAFWRADVAALRDPAAADAALALLVDPQRARTQSRLDRLRTENRHAVGSVALAPADVTVDGDRATLTDCLDDSGMSLVEADGSPVADSAGERRKVTARLVRPDEKWLVADISAASGSC